MGTYKTWICEACDVSSYLHLMAKFCTSLLSVSSSSMEPSIMVRDQHHTAASRLEKRICEQYPRQNRSMKSWWFFSGSKKKKKGWPPMENTPVNRKKGDADKVKDRGLPPWPSVRQDQRTPFWAWGLSLSREKLRVCQSSKIITSSVLAL